MQSTALFGLLQGELTPSQPDPGQLPPSQVMSPKLTKADVLTAWVTLTTASLIGDFSLNS